jgi:hypothetical protein
MGQYQQQSLTRGNGGLIMTEMTSSEPQRIEEKEINERAVSLPGERPDRLRRNRILPALLLLSVSR